ALNSLSFLAVLAGLLLMRASELYPVERERKAAGAVREGLAYARRTPAVLAVLLMVTVVSATGFNFRVLLPVLADKTLHSGAAVFGALFASFGVGALGGALLSAALSRAS